MGLPGNYPIFHPNVPGRTEGFCAEFPLSLHTFLDFKTLTLSHPGDISGLSPGLLLSAPQRERELMHGRVMHGEHAGCTWEGIVGYSREAGIPTMVGRRLVYQGTSHPPWVHLCVSLTHRGYTSGYLPPTVCSMLGTSLPPCVACWVYHCYHRCAHPGYTTVITVVHIPGYISHTQAIPGLHLSYPGYTRRHARLYTPSGRHAGLYTPLGRAPRGALYPFHCWPVMRVPAIIPGITLSELLTFLIKDGNKDGFKTGLQEREVSRRVERAFLHPFHCWAIP